jgi:phage terminase large subunit
MKIQIQPTAKQFQALQYLNDKTTEFIGFGGGANGGKSWIGCVWLVTSCYAYPGIRLFVGREELKRLRESTFLTFYKVHSAYGFPASDFKYNGADHYFQFTNGSRIDLLDLKYLPSDPLYERYGSVEYTSGWIEEAGEVHFDAFDTLKSRIGRHLNDKFGILGKMFVTMNPKRNWTYNTFYKPWKNNELPNNVKFIQALVGDNDFREQGSLEKLQQITNKAKRERLLYGNWNYEDEPDQLILYEWLDAALDVKHEKGKKALGVDVARYGDDKSVICEMDGNALIELKTYEGLSIDVFADKVAEKIRSNSIDADLVGIDAVGLGAGTVDILRRKGLKVKDIVSGEGQERTITDKEYNFKNLRSQMWWTIREELRKGEIAIKCNDDLLFEDLTAPKYEIVGEKMVQIESKKDIKARIGRSPDVGDAFVYANWIRKKRANNTITALPRLF